MPLLSLEPFLLPEDLFETWQPQTGEADCWWVLHTRPRAEKSLARKCLPTGVSFFLPQYEHRWRSRGRMLKAHLPLFPGYFFLRGDYQARLEALKTNLVVSCLTVPDQQQLHADLTRLHRLITAGTALAPEDHLTPGAWVEITSGPLMGLTGKILRRGGGCRFVVEIQFLQRGVSAEVEGWTIRPASPPTPAPCLGA
jgi:transcriptional antiterminator RfaH